MHQRIWGIVVLVLVISIPIISRLKRCDPSFIDLDRTLKGVSIESPFGTDALGRDIFCRAGRGVETSIAVGIMVTFISLIVGMFLGVISAYSGGVWDIFLQRLVEVFQSFPSIVFVIFLVAFFGAGFFKVVLALSIFGWTSYARISRSQTLAVKSEDFVESARALGMSSVLILIRQVIPFVTTPVLTQAIFGFSSAVLAEGALGFLGLPASEVSLGGMVSEGLEFVLSAPHVVTIPGALLFLLVLSVNLIGQSFVGEE